MRLRSLLVLIALLCCIGVSSHPSINHPPKQSVKQTANQPVTQSSWLALSDHNHLLSQNLHYVLNTLADPLKLLHQSIKQSIKPVDEEYSEPSYHRSANYEAFQAHLHFSGQGIEQSFERSDDETINQQIDINPVVSDAIMTSSNQAVNVSAPDDSTPPNQPDIECNYGQVVRFTKNSTSSVDVCYCSADYTVQGSADCLAPRHFTCHPKLIRVSAQTNDQSINQTTAQDVLCVPPSGPRTTLQAYDGTPFTPIQNSAYRTSEFALYDPKLTGIQPPCVATQSTATKFTFSIDCAFDSPSAEGYARPAQVAQLMSQGYRPGPLPTFIYSVFKPANNQTTGPPNATFAIVQGSIVSNALGIDWTIQNTAHLSDKRTVSQTVTPTVYLNGLIDLMLDSTQLPEGSRIGGRIYTVFSFAWKTYSPGWNAWTREVPWKIMVEDSSYVLPPPAPPRKLKPWQGWLIGLFFAVLACLVAYRLWVWYKDRQLQQMIAEQKAQTKSLYQQTS